MIVTLRSCDTTTTTGLAKQAIAILRAHEVELRQAGIRRPADCLAHIIENAERIEQYLAGMDQDAFERDRQTHDAVERCLERVCEAAHLLGRHATELMPSQPWGDIRGMGTRLRHVYDGLDIGELCDARLCRFRLRQHRPPAPLRA